ncbi:hypothetical protein A1Q2_00392 [Trichosporon asahii var. asahii CBS 8904]|uniref:C3H1-type domain-containing protein n=1 Tax=Trichosporon asahii var. asahii (strain CBS 8904) TaxID=1220162 RepID=K1WX81_TRIAC|nr:hypothetical protein A1Q2_00392 [Trichosporon asahii var. asahii CBS 8904]
MSYGMHPTGAHGAAGPSSSRVHAPTPVQVKAEPIEIDQEPVDIKPQIQELMRDAKIDFSHSSPQSNGSAVPPAEVKDEKPLVEVKPVVDVDMSYDSGASTPITGDSSRNGSPAVGLPPIDSSTVPGPSRRRLEPVVLIPRRKRGSVALASEEEVKRFVNSGRTDSSSIVKNATQKTYDGSEESRAMMREIHKLLIPGVLQQNKPGHLFKHLRFREDDDGNERPPLFEPTPQQLANIMTELSQHATASYLAAMGDSDRYTEMFRVWLRNSIREPEKWEVSLAPILNVLSRTDMPVNYIQEDFKIGRLAKRAVDKAIEANLFTTPQIRKAYAKYDNYCKEVLFPKNRRKSLDSDSEDDTPQVTKKRKLDSKPAVPTRSAPTPKPSAASGSKVPGRADMSFFGAKSDSASAAAKPKPKLPNFTKRAADAPVPATSSLLASTMKMLKKEDPMTKPAAPPSRPSPAAAAPPPRQPAKPAVKLNKKGHAVRWVDETPSAGREFEAIKLFKQEPHEMERPYWLQDGMSVHDLDTQEGQLMHQSPVYDDIEEVIEWYEPKLRRAASPDARVRGAGEAGVLLPADQLHHVKRHSAVPDRVDAGDQAQNSVSDLLKNLTGALPAAVAPSAPAYGGGYDYNAQYYQNPPSYGPSAGQSQAHAPGWNGGYNNHNQHHNQQHSQPGGWNRDAPGYTGNRWSRPQPKKPCKFFRMHGNCKLGNRCNFLHS